MKKLLAVCMVVVSLNVVAENHMMGESRGMPMTGEAGHMHSLTPEQQNEFQDMMNAHMRENHKLMLEMRSIDLEIEREMLKDKPNKKNIDILIDKRSKLHSDMYKNMLRNRMEIKEKLGVDMMGPMGGPMMMQRGGYHNQMMSY